MSRSFSSSSPSSPINPLQKNFLMNKINTLFSDLKDRKLLSLYFCAGAPTLDATADVILTLQQRGIDMIEVGIPFSDPMADGPVIQDAATTALKNGMTLPTLFAQLKAIKDQRVIMLITPETSEERIRFIDEHTDGFIYMVSSAAITGTQKSFDEQKQDYFRRINAMNLRNPRMIGFGISNRQTLEAAQQNAAGAIIGSKFVTLLSEEGNANRALDRLFEALSQ